MTTLTQPFTVGEPQVAGPLTVFPGLGPDPRLAYRTFADAAGLGALVNELEGEAAVNEVVLGTPTELPLLAYEGEEILGAQQNRTFDISVLVYAQTAERVPVSCVERERWDGSRHDEAVHPLAAGGRPGAARTQARDRQRAPSSGARHAPSRRRSGPSCRSG